MESRNPPRWKFTAILLACLMLSLICVLYPIYVIRPFRAQGARELAVALAVLRFRPLLTAMSALVAAGAVIGYWRARTRIWRRLLVTVGAAFVFVLAALARVNIYEMMFHHLDHPEFAAASETKLDNDDKVIAVKIGASARAYPIRTMGYHHVANDLVGGTAVVATY
jgi:Protein of unknown function (DUF3179)